MVDHNHHPAEDGPGLSHLACGGYFATLLTLLLGTLLLLGKAPTSIVPPARVSFGQPPTKTLSHLARGPTAPALQVFRL